MVKEQLRDILDKEMNRKDFLRYVGIALVSLIGLPSVISALQHLGSAPGGSSVGRSTSYGGSTPPLQVKGRS